jgi:hypothetical protein
MVIFVVADNYARTQKANAGRWKDWHVCLVPILLRTVEGFGEW